MSFAALKDVWNLRDVGRRCAGDPPLLKRHHERDQRIAVRGGGVTVWRIASPMAAASIAGRLRWARTSPSREAIAWCVTSSRPSVTALVVRQAHALYRS